MSGEVEAAGALVTAATVAAVLDPPAARPVDAAVEPAPAACLNCGTMLLGDHCHRCGQSAHVHRSLSHMLHEAVHGILHFEGSFWRTLPLLATRPGGLTRDYVMGQRKRFISPVAMFLLTIFAMFFLFGFTGGSAINLGDGVRVEANGAAVMVEPAQRVAALEDMLARIDADIAAARQDPAKADDLAALLTGRAGTAAALESARAVVRGDAAAPPVWAEAIRGAAEAGGIKVNTGNAALDRKAMAALRNPELVAYKMQQKGYKLSFLLVPLSLPWMMLLFAGRRDVRTYDHVVFLLYSISFMSFLVMAAVLLAGLGAGHPLLLVLLLGVLPLVHLYRQLKGAYLLTRAGALWRTAALSLAAILSLSLYGILILMLGLLD